MHVVVIAGLGFLEEGGRDLGAETAADALLVHIECAGNVVFESIIGISHAGSIAAFNVEEMAIVCHIIAEIARMSGFPFDLQDLRHFQFVAEAGSFSLAASRANLSPSALSRQIQGLEERLGEQLLIRTTRTVRLTEAGEYWLERAIQLLRRAEAVWEGHAERFQERSPVVRVGVCQTIGMAYLPGFFHAYRRRFPQWHVRLHQAREDALLKDLDELEIDVAILATPRDLPPGCESVYSFEDGFVGIGPESSSGSNQPFEQGLVDRPYIALDRETRTGAWLAGELRRRGGATEPVMELDNYDLIINSVALGLGYAIVPHRALAIYSRSRRFVRHAFGEPLVRTLSVAVRSNPRRPRHLVEFINSILF